ncbi:MAG: hypothetical protein COW71_12445 [Ignavibacteriales bacterium CG18_big_fil_WC_8_21_14_2_50_31_20]|nr:MAG: hypothetical protein COW71_12445 [Ignavibacteriales bacterium CG18_big_fil_WC_8_21_14_2_50_31_20]
MTNAQKWVTVFLILFVLLLALSKLTNKDEKSSAANYSEENVNPNETVQINAEKLISQNKCLTCHGRDLGGSGMGPSLTNLSDNWEKDALINYLKDPSSFLNIARMAVLREKYGSDMPAVKNLSNDEISAIAEFLLKLKRD